MVERMYSYFILISDKVHIYSGEGRKMAAQHVMMISINHARIYLGLRASPSVCSRSSSLSRNGGLAILPLIEIGFLTLWSHMPVICQKEVCSPTGHTRTWFCTFILLLLCHSLQGALHYDAFLSMHFHHQRDFRRVWFNA